MQIRLLGPVEVELAGRPLRLGGPKQRAVLALLALNANVTVAVDRLIEAVWGEEQPASAAKMVQLYVSQLRKLLARGDGVEIVTHGRGYELRIDRDAVDAARFERLVGEASQRTGAGEAAQRALALWRGPPFADLDDEPFARAEARRLEELHLFALELAIESDLEAGRHREVIGRLESLVAEHPFRERLHGLRMLALYRAGRQAEALEAYRAARTALVQMVGAEPGPELHRLHQAILRQDRALDLAARPMRAERLDRAIEGSARKAGLVVEPELVVEPQLATGLVEDVAGQAGGLRLLSTTLLQSWQRRDGRRLRLAAYGRTHGVHGAVARLAEDAYGRLAPEQLNESRLASQWEAARSRRANRRVRALPAAAAVAFAIAIAAGLVAVDQRGDARDAALAAHAQRLGAQALTDERLERALLLARVGVKLDGSLATRSNVLAALLRSPRAELGVLRGIADAEIDAVAVSPDGRRVTLGDAAGITVLDSSTRHTFRRKSRAILPPFRKPAFLEMASPMFLLAASDDQPNVCVDITHVIERRLQVLDSCG